jgi:hypothetical protein
MTLLLLIACSTPSTIRKGLPETGDTGAFLMNLPGDDSEDSSLDSPPESSPLDVDILACYLSEDRDYATCLRPVSYDASWGSDYEYPEPYNGSPQYSIPARYLDISDLDPDLKLAPNFVVSEFLSESKGRYGVLQASFIERIQSLRDAIGEPLYITSGYRNPGYNASVGGVSSSRHMYGDAADAYANGLSVEELGVECELQDASYVGLYEDGHTHCDWRDDSLDTAFYDTTGGPVPPEEQAALEQKDGLWQAPATGFDEGEPFRRWNAYDAQGRLLLTATGRSFVPPPATARIEVQIGGRLSLERVF